MFHVFDLMSIDIKNRTFYRIEILRLKENIILRIRKCWLHRFVCLDTSIIVMSNSEKIIGSPRKKSMQ